MIDLDLVCWHPQIGLGMFDIRNRFRFALSLRATHPLVRTEVMRDAPHHRGKADSVSGAVRALRALAADPLLVPLCVAIHYPGRLLRRRQSSGQAPPHTVTPSATGPIDNPPDL